MKNIYDLIIVGSGPAGLSASIFAFRYKLKHLILGVETGGQMLEIYEIENYPGYSSIKGKYLKEKLVEHVQKFGMSIKNESVFALEKNKDVFKLQTSQGIYWTKTIIMAMGAHYRQMNIPGEKEFIGKGVSYCATCDAMFFKNKIVSVVGGGNSATVVALELADYAKQVYLVHRGEKMLAEPMWIEKLRKNKKIVLLADNSVLAIEGKNKVEKIVLKKLIKGKKTLDVDGVFIEVGTEPGVELAKKIGVKTDKQDYIKVGVDMSTNIAGIFAAGDITTGSNKFRQVLMAAAEGALAANSAYKMLKSFEYSVSKSN
jgi:thioredoxin reductase (NADPH)